MDMVTFLCDLFTVFHQLFVLMQDANIESELGKNNDVDYSGCIFLAALWQYIESAQTLPRRNCKLYHSSRV